MNFLRRFALILYGLALLALVTVILMFPTEVAQAIQSLTQFSSLERGVATFVVDALILLALFLLVRQTRPYSKDGLMVKASGALTDVSVDSARERIVKAINAVPNVVSTEARLQALNGRADIELDVGVAGAHINVPDKQREIDRALRQVMLKQLGLQLAHPPRVHIRLLSEQEAAPRREDVARPIITPPSFERREALPREEQSTVRVTPPADAPDPTLGELASAPEEAELWAAMRSPEPAIPAPVPKVAEDRTPVEDDAGMIASVSEPETTTVEHETALPPRMERVEAYEEFVEPDAPLAAISEGMSEGDGDIDAEESERPILIAPVDSRTLSDIDPDYADSSDDESSERPSTGLYGEEEGDLHTPDSDRRPPSFNDLD